MISFHALEERFMRDPAPVRMGGIASDLARLSGLVKPQMDNLSAAENILTELKWFTEWVAKDTSLSAQETLLALQRNLADWSLNGFQTSRSDEIQKKTKNWSKIILDISGLLPKCNQSCI